MNKLSRINDIPAPGSDRGIFGEDHLTEAQRYLGIAMRAFVGNGKMYSFKDLHELTDISISQLEKFAAREATPSLGKFLRLVYFMPPEFLDIILTPAQLGGVRRLSEGRADSLGLNADVAQLLASIAVCLEDGHVDHRERLELLPMARRARTRLDDWIARVEKESAA